MSQAEFYRGIEAAQMALAKSHATTPAGRAAAVHVAMGPLFDHTTASNHRVCRAGCAHCCHLPVGLTFGEAVHLADAVRDLPAVSARIVHEAERTVAMPWSKLVGLACPLLADQRCVAHAARPLPCRALASSDADACGRALHGPANVPVDDVAFWRGTGASSVLAEAGVPTGSRELRSALHAMLTRSADVVQAFTAARPAGAEEVDQQSR